MAHRELPTEKQQEQEAIDLLASSLEADARAGNWQAAVWLFAAGGGLTVGVGPIVAGNTAWVIAGLSVLQVAVFGFCRYRFNHHLRVGTRRRSDYERFVLGSAPWHQSADTAGERVADARAFAIRRPERYIQLADWFDASRSTGDPDRDSLGVLLESVSYGQDLRTAWLRLQAAMSAAVLALLIAGVVSATEGPWSWAIAIGATVIVVYLAEDLLSLKGHIAERGRVRRVLDQSLDDGDSLQHRSIAAVEMIATLRASRTRVPNWFYELYDKRLRSRATAAS